MPIKYFPWGKYLEKVLSWTVVGTTDIATSSLNPNYVDMPQMTLTFDGPGTFLIAFTGCAWVTATGKMQAINTRLLIDGTTDYPGSSGIGRKCFIYIDVTAGPIQLAGMVSWQLIRVLGVGSHTIKVQWCIYKAGTAQIRSAQGHEYRELMVLKLAT